MNPIILLCGESGSGKDTIAGLLAKNHRTQAIAFADPMKRFAMSVFGFTEEQLWGPSEARNQIDTRFADHEVCNTVLYRIEEATPKSSVYKDLRVGSNLQHRSLQSWASRLLKEAQEQGGLSARKMLQLLGTEWGRRISPSMWVDQALDAAEEILHYGRTYHRTTGLSDETGQAPDFVCISDGRFRNEILTMRTLGAQVWKIRSSVNTNTAVAGIAGHASEAEQRSVPDFYYTHIIDNDKASGLDALEQTVKLAVTGITEYALKPEWLSTKLAATPSW
jgi:predicted kinase